MRIKKDFILCFLPVVAVFCFVFLSPAFADMKKVDEAELARTNATVSGAPVNKQVTSVEKGVDNPETWRTSETLNKGDVAFSPSVNRESITLDMNVKGSPTHQFYFGGSTSNMTGGITCVPTRRSPLFKVCSTTRPSNSSERTPENRPCITRAFMISRTSASP